MKLRDLKLVGVIYIIVVAIGLVAYQEYKITSLKTVINKQQTEITELNSHMDVVYNNLNSMNDYANELLGQISSISKDVRLLLKIKDELRRYSEEEQAIGLALAWSESTWNPNVDHRDNGYTQGICGVTPSNWKVYLDEKNVPINSVSACIEIYKYYKETHKGSRELAIKKYKGIENNTALIQKTLKYKSIVLKTMKESK